MAGVASVNIASLDAEHEACVDALNLLRVERSSAALDNVHTCIATHFQHEEDLLTEHEWGVGAGGSSSFSAFRSHQQDHQRILKVVQAERARCAAAGRRGKRPFVSSAFVRALMLGFGEHADHYDNHYVDHLNSRGVQ
jgi:hemerythrin